ncbi:phage portal protein, partial [Klebsiella pneumoniae]|uniref:phage portal protein n=1 Tax=Klebsiella pneumoniae TaxID=573 RepID=UPI003B5AA77A
MAPVLESMKQLSRYSDAELTAALVSSMFTVFITTKSPAETIVGGFRGVESIPGAQPQKALPEPDYTLGSGTVV